jgi:hypothetical protein
VLRLFAPPTRSEKLVDLLLGVSRRRRKLAYAAIGGGFVALRPLLKRAAVVGLAAVVLILI